MANPDYEPGAFFKHKTVVPRVVRKVSRAKVEDSEWRRVCKDVDARDKRRCQVTGKPLEGGAVDPWHALERHHLEPRSRNKSRRFTAVNVWTVARAIHRLIHGGALLVLNKRGQPAKDVRDIDHLAWNRNVVPRGMEPCRVKKWPMVELDQVRD